MKSLSSRPPRRQGFVLVLVLIMAFIVGAMVFLFQNSVSRESRGTHRLVRAMHAETVADSVVTQLASVLHQDPWEDRFYLRRSLRLAEADGQAPSVEYAFNHEAFPFHETGPEYLSGRVGFVGSIKDVSAPEKRYRVRVLVHVDGVEFLTVYEMRYVQGLLGPLNRDPVVQRAVLLEDTPPDLVDARVDAIWKKASDLSLKVVDPGDLPLVAQAAPMLALEAAAASFQVPPDPPPEVASSARARASVAPAASEIRGRLDEGVAQPSRIRVPEGWRPAGDGDSRNKKKKKKKGNGASNDELDAGNMAQLEAILAQAGFAGSLPYAAGNLGGLAPGAGMPGGGGSQNPFAAPAQTGSGIVPSGGRGSTLPAN